MGIFMEEVLSNTSTREIVKESVNVEDLLIKNEELKIQNEQLISEMMDMFIDKLNEECVFTESFFDDLKVKKKDLEDPNKVKAIIKRIENEALTPSTKDNLLNFLYSMLLVIAGAVIPGPITGLGILLNNQMIQMLGLLLQSICPAILTLVGTDRYNKYISKTQKAIKKVEKKASKEKDPEKAKLLNERLSVLKKNLKQFEDANLKAKKEIRDGKTRMW